MFTSILIFLFSVIVSAVLFKFGIATTPTLKLFAKRMLPAFTVVILLLGGNILYTLNAKNALQSVIDLPPVTDSTELATVQSGEPLVLVAIASPDNPIKGRNNEYLAYVDGNGLWTPLKILLDLEDTQIAMTNDNYRTRNWKRDNKINYINPGQRLTIVGRNLIGEVMTGDDKDKQINAIEGILVYAGSHNQFIQDTTRRLWGPRIMAGLSAFALGATVLGVIIAAVKIAMTKSA
ncbi:hypothetical protein [[Limnothrix rosea] IAM M-220]|uniref:hypothetical protein n=1 Tax=[Limnothrix rosea] IAM M-220 TaxID=454133 RepID=UPI000961C6CA|nr:hypothetical protein [[Limnothrix rosea] IAM M-220]OKH18056.1 hypothetical protein NIES208_06850 [[Limnothrix rosea] IAM M-220]